MPQSLESLLARIAALRDRQAKLAAEQEELLRQMAELAAQREELKAVVSDQCARAAPRPLHQDRCTKTAKPK